MFSQMKSLKKKNVIFKTKFITMEIRLHSWKDLNFVQFSPQAQAESFQVCSEKSKYLDGTVFSLFQHCFELSSGNYDYYKISSFNGQEVVALRNHLITNQTRISSIMSAFDFEKFLLKQVSGIEFLNTLKNNYSDWKMQWERIKSELIRVGEELIEMVDNCIDEDFILRVKGF